MTMDIYARIDAFVQLGEEIEKRTQKDKWEQCIQKASALHPFFTEETIGKALEKLAEYLNYDSLYQWCINYPALFVADADSQRQMKKIALVMAGNIPLVGFHDFISVLLAGQKTLIKPSSNDPYLLAFLAKLLIEIEPAFSSRIEFTSVQLKNFDAIIATGSNNSSRYFDYYFGKYPHIIRKNRNSCAILTGNENEADLLNLAADMMDYYGLGCRNVSKLYFPKTYSLTSLLKATEIYEEYAQHNAYRNNYDYQKSLLLINKIPHLDNGILLLKEHPALATPVSVYNFEYYEDISTLRKELINQKDMIQCIVSGDPMDIPFGKTQSPAWTDYADEKDTLDFLVSL